MNNSLPRITVKDPNVDTRKNADVFVINNGSELSTRNQDNWAFRTPYIKISSDSLQMEDPQIKNTTATNYIRFSSGSDSVLLYGNTFYINRVEQHHIVTPTDEE